MVSPSIQVPLPALPKHPAWGHSPLAPGSGRQQQCWCQDENTGPRQLLQTHNLNHVFPGKIKNPFDLLDIFSIEHCIPVLSFWKYFALTKGSSSPLSPNSMHLKIITHENGLEKKFWCMLFTHPVGQFSFSCCMCWHRNELWSAAHLWLRSVDGRSQAGCRCGLVPWGQEWFIFWFGDFYLYALPVDGGEYFSVAPHEQAKPGPCVRASNNHVSRVAGL